MRTSVRSHNGTVVFARRSRTPPQPNRFHTLLGVCVLASAGLIHVDRSATAAQAVPRWLTDGGDAQRTGWQRAEARFTIANARTIELLWKIHLDHAPRQMHALHPALVSGAIATPDGPRSIVVVAGVSDTLFGVDATDGRLRWGRRFESRYRPGPTGYGALCPGGQLATPVLALDGRGDGAIIYAVAWDGRLHAVNVATGSEIGAPAPFLPPD